MKVVILNNDFRVYWKGRLLYLHRYLASHNIDFFAVEIFGKGSPYAFDGLYDEQSWWTCLFPDKSSADLSKFKIRKAIHSTLDSLKPDIVIGPSIVFFPGALGISWVKSNKKKFIMFDDAKPSQIQRSRVIQTIKNLIISQSDSLWLPSNSYKAEYAFFSNKGTHFFYGFSTIDNDFFRLGANYNAQNKSLVCVARLVSIKNIDSLLRAWQQVEKRNTSYRLIIIGNGPEEEGLKRLNLLLGNTTVDFVNVVDNEALPAYFKSANAFILPSLTETWGLVVNEAMAAKLPVLLSNTINATDDLLDNGVNGFGFNPLDENDIYTAILKFIDLSDEAKQAMSLASAHIIDAFSYERMAAQLLKELKRLLEKPYKKPKLIAGIIIQLWYGRYNTAGWDNIQNNKR